MKLPNGASILIGVVLVAALTALAGELPNSATGWLPVAGAAVLMGIAKAVQVWLDAQRLAKKHRGDVEPPELVRVWLDRNRTIQPSKLRHFFIG